MQAAKFLFKGATKNLFLRDELEPRNASTEQLNRVVEECRLIVHLPPCSRVHLVAAPTSGNRKSGQHVFFLTVSNAARESGLEVRYVHHR